MVAAAEMGDYFQLSETAMKHTFSHKFSGDFGHASYVARISVGARYGDSSSGCRGPELAKTIELPLEVEPFAKLGAPTSVAVT